MQINFFNKSLELHTPKVMGILNVTPDSFSDGGAYSRIDKALKHAANMLEEGADFIDVGGESTRPGAADVSIDQELTRVIPVIEALSKEFDTLISIDTSKPQVMVEAVSAGASMINDVRALQEEGALDAAASTGAVVCLMHMLGQPRTMQHNPSYVDVVHDVITFLSTRINACSEAGISKNNLIIDPGFGFGKSIEHNYRLLDELSAFKQLQTPILVGMSRKSMLGNLLNRNVEERLAGSIATATIAAMKGANIIRVHDVAQTVDAIKVVNALN